VITIPYSKIRDISLKANFLDRPQDIGSIYINTAGEHGIEMVLWGIPHLEKVHKAILSRMKH